MRARTTRIALGLCASLVLLAACGGRTPPLSPLADVAPTVIAPDFGDADPHDWQGRDPHAYPVHGIDTSRWQGQVDWPRARAHGVSFAFLKATEGGDILDPAFAENWRGARAAGVPVGAYHFWYHCRSASDQARWFIAHVPRAPGALPPVLDLAWTPFSPTCTKRPPAETVPQEGRLLLDRLEAHYGQRPIVYSTPDFYEANQLWRLGDYDFWLRSVAGHPQDSYAGRHWTFWQYSGTGLVPGVRGKADLNVFAGTAPQWAAWRAARSC